MRLRLPVFTCLSFALLFACTPTQVAPEPTAVRSDTDARLSSDEVGLAEDMALVATQTGIEIADLEQQAANAHATTELAMKLEAHEADTFAGLWIEWEPTYRIVVAFTEDGEATITKYVAEDSELTAVLDIRPATYSYAQLQADQHRLGRQLARMPFDTTTGINLPDNYVELTVPAASVWQEYIEQNEVDLPVSVVVSFAFEEVIHLPPAKRTPVPDIFMAQKRFPSLVSMEALLSENLLVEDGCLFAEMANGRLLIIWEPGYFAHLGENGRLQILNEAGDVVAEEGLPLYMGGGEGQPPDANILVAPIPEACRSSHVWYMGEFLPAEYRPQE